MRALPDADLTSEKLLPIAQPKAFGCDRSPRTVERWAKEGLRSPVNGQVVVLEAIYEGASIVTTRAAYLRFLREVNGIQ